MLKINFVVIGVCLGFSGVALGMQERSKEYNLYNVDELLVQPASSLEAVKQAIASGAKSICVVDEFTSQAFSKEHAPRKLLEATQSDQPDGPFYLHDIICFSGYQHLTTVMAADKAISVYGKEGVVNYTPYADWR